MQIVVFAITFNPSCSLQLWINH